MIRVPEQLSKEQVREKYLKIRDKMTGHETALKSRLIFEKLTTLDAYRSADVIHTYVTMQNRNEVDTTGLINQSILLHKTVVVPKIKDGGKLNHVEITSIKELRENSWGVKEPDSDIPFDTSRAGIIVVPMVAGDEKKNRIGYGKGYYDRFLKGTDALKIGLLYENQVYTRVLPVDRFDIPLDLLITEKRMIK